MGGQQKNFSRSVIGLAVALVLAIPILVSGALALIGAATAPGDAAALFEQLPEWLRIVERWPLLVKLAVGLLAWSTYAWFLFGADRLKKLWWFLSDRDQRAAQLKMFADNRALMDLREKLGARWILVSCDWTSIETPRPLNAQFLFETMSSKREEIFRRLASGLGQASAHVAFKAIEKRAARRPEEYTEGEFAFYNEGNRVIFNEIVALVAETNLFLARLKAQLEFSAGMIYWENLPRHSIHEWVERDSNTA